MNFTFPIKNISWKKIGQLISRTKVQNIEEDNKTIVKLERQEEIAMGGTSIIYRNSYSNGWREIEKILIPKFQGLQDYELLQKREYDLLSSFHHPLIIRPIRLETREAIGWGSTSVLILEFVQGAPLSLVWNFIEVLNAEARNTWAYECLHQLLSALNYLHAQNVIHGDIAPDNILIQPNGYIKLIDFGVARREEDGMLPFKVAGRNFYRAPEIFSNGKTSKEADLFAVGRIFEQLLGEELAKEVQNQGVLNTLQEKRQAPSLSRSSAGWFQGLNPLPSEKQLYQEGKLKQKTQVMEQPKWFLLSPEAIYLWILLMLFPAVTSYLPQEGKLTINSIPYSSVAINHLGSHIRFETPVRKLSVPSGLLQLQFVIPSQKNRQIVKSLTVPPGEHVKIFEDFRKN